MERRTTVHSPPTSEASERQREKLSRQDTKKGRRHIPQRMAPPDREETEEELRREKAPRVREEVNKKGSVTAPTLSLCCVRKTQWFPKKTCWRISGGDRP